MRVLALDFDGVISDSAPESFVVAYRTFAELRPVDVPELPGLAHLEGDAAPVLADVLAAPGYPGFLELMPLGNRAEDYGVVLTALARGESVPDQAAYDRVRATCADPWLASYHARFYEKRRALAEADPVGWHELMAVYPALPEWLRRRSGDVTLAIATAKDRPTVLALLRRYGVADLFPGERLLDKEAGVSKTAHLQQLQQRTGASYPEIHFIDDKVNHLDAVSSLGVTCGLAAWGYNGERERRLARERGHAVHDLPGLDGELFPGSASSLIPS